MKQFKFITLIAAIVCLTFSCSKDDASDPSNPNNLSIGTISAKVNGTTISSTLGNAAILDFPEDTEYFFISGVEELGNAESDVIYVDFTIPATKTLGEKTYQFQDDDCDEEEICGSIGFGGPNNELMGDSDSADGKATIDVTSLDYEKNGHVRGTFSGQYLSDETGELVEVTDGRFNVPIIQ